MVSAGVEQSSDQARRAPWRPLADVLASGLADAGLASLATLAVGVVAVRTLSVDGLALYALLFTGFVLAAAVPAQLLFTPIENDLVGLPEARQRGTLRSSLLRGAVISGACSAAVVAVVAVVASMVGIPFSAPLAITAAATIVVSPLQDHGRRMLHQLGMSSSAALVSLVQVITVVVAMGVLVVSDVDTAWLPLGSLAVANVVTFVLVVTLLHRGEIGTPVDLPLATVVKVGGWLTVSAFIRPAANFLAYIVLAQVVDAEAVGLAEGVRIVAMPVLVVAVGLAAVLRPRVVGAAKARDESMVRQLHRAGAWLALVVGLAAVTAIGFDWPLNPLARLVPLAYEVAGLAALMVTAAAVFLATASVQLELQATGRERPLATVTALAAGVNLVVVVLLAPAIGVWALAVGALLGEVAVAAGCVRIRRPVDTVAPEDIESALPRLHLASTDRWWTFMTPTPTFERRLDEIHQQQFDVPTDDTHEPLSGDVQAHPSDEPSDGRAARSDARRPERPRPDDDPTRPSDASVLRPVLEGIVDHLQLVGVIVAVGAILGATAGSLDTSEIDVTSVIAGALLGVGVAVAAVSWLQSAPGQVTGAERTIPVVVMMTAAGFMSMHRFFAHLGSPSLGVSIGEVVLVVALVAPGARIAMTNGLAWLLQPGPLHAVVWTGSLFVGFGMLSTMRGLAAGHGFDALRVFAFHYYAVVLLLGVWIGQRGPRRLASFVRVYAWFNGIYAVVFVLVLDRLGITAPGTDTTLILGTGSAIAIVGLLCTVRPIGSVWYLYVLNGLAMLIGQGRAEWVSLFVGLMLWGILERRLRLVAAGFAAAVILLLAVAFLDVTIPTASGRGGNITVSEISGRLIAPFDLETARALTDEADAFAVSAEWRSRWWGAIWEGVRSDETTLLVGYGGGYPLSELVDFVEEDVRSPHNIFFFVVGYEGVIGLALFGAFQGAILVALWRVRERTGQIVGIVWWAVLLTLSFFSVWYDSPVGAFPSYLLLGMALAPLAAGAEHGPAGERSDDLEGALT